MRNVFFAALMLCPLALSPHASADDWTQFRGPNASGVSSSKKSLPTEFSVKKNMLWSIQVGDGIGSPIVAGGKLFNTAMADKDTFTVFALDAKTGSELWKRELKTGKLPRITPPNSHASSTPATDGKRVYAYFSTLGLLAFDAATGDKVWQQPLPKPAYLMDWGAASSPIVYKDMVIFNQDDDLNPFLLAVDAATGKIRWKTPRPDMLAGYAVPVICPTDKGDEIVIAGSGKMQGYDPKTGKLLWTCNSLLRTIMTSPVVHDGTIYISVQSYGDETRTLKYALMQWLDTNQDDKLAIAEVPKEFLAKFKQSDKNGDGFIMGKELDTAFQSADNQVGGGNIIQAIRGGGRGDVTKTHLLWNINNKSPSNLSSPIVVNNELFVVKRGGLSSCFDIKSGKTLWRRERLHNHGEYYASPVAADGKIYVAGENGFIVVLKQGRELEILASNDVDGRRILATPAIADGCLFVRTRERIFCFTNKQK